MRIRLKNGESGSGSILALSLIAVMMVMVSATVPLVAVLETRRGVAAAADAAALAGAAVLLGFAPGVACDSAAAVAAANGSQLSRCVTEGSTIVVKTGRVVFGFPVQSQATAGPAQH